MFTWLSTRFGLLQKIQKHSTESIADTAVVRLSLGSAFVFLFALQLVLGVLLAFYFAPSASDAWASTVYLEQTVPGGSLLRSMHHRAGDVMIVVGLLWLLATLVEGALKPPREILWWSLLGILLLTVLTALSGSLLPWDAQAVGRLAVETGILEGTPGGGILKRLVVGGGEFGNFTVLRLYIAHVILLPGAIILLLKAHASARVQTSALPSDAQENHRFRPRWERQFWFDLLAMGIAAASVAAVSMKLGPIEIFAPAEAGSTFVARPEWYFLSLFQLLKYFEGGLQIVATVVLPGLGLGFLAVLPWLDRYSTSQPLKRLMIILPVGLMLAGVVGLSTIAIGHDKRDKEYQKTVAIQEKQAALALSLAKLGVPPEGNEAVYQNHPEYKLRKLFKEQCQNCHSIDGIGGDEAPSFEGYNTRPYLSSLVRNASGAKFFKGTKHDGMDPYPADKISDEDLKAIVERIIQLGGSELGTVDSALASRGKELMADGDCGDCHEEVEGESADGPNHFQRGSIAWIERVIKDSSAEDLFGEEAQMPKFANKLSAEEIRQLAEFVQKQGATPFEEAE